MTIEEALLSYSIPFSRALGFFSILPLGMSASALGLRVLLAALAASLAPDASLGEGSAFVLGAEFLIGVLCGLPAALVVSCAGMWGELVDVARGQNLAQLFDPLHETQDSASAALARNLVWAALLSMGLGEEIMKSVHDSFLVISAAKLSAHGIDASLLEAGQGIIGYLGTVMSALCLAALPLVGIFLATELGGAFVCRVVPGLSLSSELFWIKAALVLWVTLFYAEPGTFSSLFQLASERIFS